MLSILCDEALVEEQEVPHMEMASGIETLQSLALQCYVATDAQTLVGCAYPTQTALLLEPSMS